MSRSFRKTPVFGHTGCKSEKEDKRKANRAFRRRNKQILHRDGEEATLFAVMNEVSNVWSMGKDGRSYWPEKAGCFGTPGRYSWRTLQSHEEWLESRRESWIKAMRK